MNFLFFPSIKSAFFPWMSFWVPYKTWSSPQWSTTTQWWRIQSSWRSSVLSILQLTPSNSPFFPKCWTCFFFGFQASWVPCRGFQSRFCRGGVQTQAIRDLTECQHWVSFVIFRRFWSRWSKLRRLRPVCVCWGTGRMFRWLWSMRFAIVHRPCGWFRFRTYWGIWVRCQRNIFDWPLSKWEKYIGFNRSSVFRDHWGGRSVSWRRLKREEWWLWEEVWS